VKASRKKFEEEELTGLVEAKYKELHPDDEDNSEIKKLTTKIEKLEAKDKRNTLLKSAMEVVNDAKIPFNKPELLELLIGEDEKTTADNINLLAEIHNEAVGKAVKEALGEGNGREDDELPPGAKKEIDSLEKQYDEAKKSKNTLDMIRIKNQIAQKRQAAKK
jgi:hypothetical protein